MGGVVTQEGEGDSQTCKLRDTGDAARWEQEDVGGRRHGTRKMSGRGPREKMRLHARGRSIGNEDRGGTFACASSLRGPEGREVRGGEGPGDALLDATTRTERSPCGGSEEGERVSRL